MEETANVGKKALKRHWVGWKSKLESVETPYSKWKTRAVRVGRDEAGKTYVFTYAAVIDAEDREKAWHDVARLFADAEELFVREKTGDFWPPADRFPEAS